MIRSVVIAGLEELDPISEDFVDQPIRLIYPARPDVAAEVLERFGFANANEGVSQDCLDQIQRTQGSLAVCFDPVAEIFEAFVLHDGGPPAFGAPAQDASSSPSSRRSARRSAGLVRPRRARVSAASNRAAFCGDRRR